MVSYYQQAYNRSVAELHPVKQSILDCQVKPSHRKAKKNLDDTGLEQKETILFKVTDSVVEGA